MNDSKNTTRFFLQQDRVHAALTGSAAVVCMRVQSGVLAETRVTEETTRSALLAADSGDSVLRVKSQALPESVAYSAYGLHSPNDIPAQRPAFNGHLLVSHLYLLGNGYRGYNPVLMRFHSPDSLSPFAAGGSNCYAYCAGDPVNFSDPSGHMYRPRARSPSPLSRTVLEVLETQPGWRSAGGNERSRSPASLDRIVLEALNTQPGWNNSGVPVQMNQQRTLTLNAAQAQPLPATSTAVPETRLPAPTVSAGGRVWDTWANKRKNLTDEEFNLLVDANAENKFKLLGRDVAESKEIRRVAIDALRGGRNINLALRNSRFGLTTYEAKRAQHSIYTMLTKRTGR